MLPSQRWGRLRYYDAAPSPGTQKTCGSCSQVCHALWWFEMFVCGRFSPSHLCAVDPTSHIVYLNSPATAHTRVAFMEDLAPVAPAPGTVAQRLSFRRGTGSSEEQLATPTVVLEHAPASGAASHRRPVYPHDWLAYHRELGVVPAALVARWEAQAALAQRLAAATPASPRELPPVRCPPATTPDPSAASDVSSALGCAAGDSAHASDGQDGGDESDILLRRFASVAAPATVTVATAVLPVAVAVVDAALVPEPIVPAPQAEPPRDVAAPSPLPPPTGEDEVHGVHGDAGAAVLPAAQAPARPRVVDPVEPLAHQPAETPAPSPTPPCVSTPTPVPAVALGTTTATTTATAPAQLQRAVSAPEIRDGVPPPHPSPGAGGGSGTRLPAPPPALRSSSLPPKRTVPRKVRGPT